MIDNCFCGNHNAHTRECKEKTRGMEINAQRRDLWAERVKNQCCGCCGEKIKPRVIYPSRCEGCNNKTNGKNKSS